MFAAAAVVGMFSFGPLLPVPVLPALAFFFVLAPRLDRFRRPELFLFCGVCVVQLGVAGSLVIATGPSVYLLPVLMLPALLASVVFPVRTAVVLVAFSAVLMLAVGLGFDYDQVRVMPFALVYPVSVLIGGSLVAMVVAGLDKSTRATAVQDPLTDLPNRIALQARVAELEHQSAINGRPVALIVGDPDRFKSVNDWHGHATGDAVLREVAARIRAALPAGAAAYRLGGEEFVVLVRDANVAVGAELAEKLRLAVTARAIEGLAVPMSFGVAATSAGEPFSFSLVFGQADRALYEAKHAGGDRVRMWPLAAPDAVDARRHADSANASGAVARAPGHVEPAPRTPSRDRGPTRLSVQELTRRWERLTALEHAATGSWLIRDAVHRRQLLELNRRLRDKAWAAFVICFAGAGASATQYGWQLLVPPLVMAAVYVLVEHHVERFKHPEYALGLAWMGLALSCLAACLLASAPIPFAFPILLALLIGSSSVFPPRGVIVGVILTAGITLGIGYGESMTLISGAPGIMALDLALVVSVGLLGTAIGSSTIEYRDLGILDQLTGLFNRNALVARVAELSHRSQTEAAMVAVIVVDIDRFKVINDSHGHAVGDAVLRELGERVRKHLRAFESAYRIGGEEFVILLDEVDRGHAEQVAVRLCRAIGASPIADIPTTASVGLSALRLGLPFDYDSLFRSADAALYAAKRAGGDQVFIASEVAGDADANGGSAPPLRTEVAPLLGAAAGPSAVSDAA
jgi:diguanylate cyclase (GGDEF)-like protein